MNNIEEIAKAYNAAVIYDTEGLIAIQSRLTDGTGIFMHVPDRCDFREASAWESASKSTVERWIC